MTSNVICSSALLHILSAASDTSNWTTLIADLDQRMINRLTLQTWQMDLILNQYINWYAKIVNYLKVYIKYATLIRGAFSFCFYPYMWNVPLNRILLTWKTSFHLSHRKAASPFPQKGCFRYEGKCWCFQLYHPNVLGGAGNVLYTW